MTGIPPHLGAATGDSLLIIAKLPPVLLGSEAQFVGGLNPWHTLIVCHYQLCTWKRGGYVFGYMEYSCLGKRTNGLCVKMCEKPRVCALKSPGYWC